jgi:hypothetical protein
MDSGRKDGEKMTTVGKVGTAHPAASHPAPAPVAAAPMSQKQEFQAIINDWAHMLPVAFVNRLEEFSKKYFK